MTNSLRIRFGLVPAAMFCLGTVSCVAPPRVEIAQGARSPAGDENDREFEEERVHKAIDKGVEELLSEQITDGADKYWRYPTRLGLHFSSQYFLMLKWLKISESRLDPNVLESKLLQEQLSDGSWYQVKDGTNVHGNLDSSIFNYWALKVLLARSVPHDPTAQEKLALAKDFILKKGGLEKAALFTKVILALHGNCPWSDIPYIPLATVKTLIGRKVVLNKFSQWVIPHLKPMAYMRYHKILRELGPEYSVPELYRTPPKKNASLKASGEIKSSSHSLLLSRSIVEDTLLKEQLPRGSWGAYSLATLFSVVSLDHFEQQSANKLDDSKKSQILSAKLRGLKFIEELYFDSGDSSYYGVLDDSTYWDSGLAIWALAENGLDLPQRTATADYLVRQQQKNGGFPFGYDFWPYPDVDDTYAIVMGFRGLEKYKRAENGGLDFILKRQNKDGGWGTFDVDNTGNLLLKIASGKVANSADLFDESEPDVTGHALEMIGRLQGSKADPKMIQRTYAFLKKTRNPKVKVWASRWEMNYLFGTFAVVSGLRSAGFPVTDPLIADAVAWLKARQNADGGYGESADSYDTEEWAGKGISTPSQTSWALATLVEVGEGDSLEARRAVDYLLAQHSLGPWKDLSAVGTGHPRILYMEYPSYPRTFPLIGLGKYAADQCQRKSFRGEWCARYLQKDVKSLEN